MSALIQLEELNREFELNRSKLKSFVFRITANTADTEDIIQDTYIRAATKLETFKGMSSLKTWLFSIASNLAKDHLRSKKRWPANAMDLARDESMKHPDVHLARFLQINHASPMGQFEVREHIGFCFTCIEKTLPLEQQLAILLKEIFDFQVAEIAEILDRTQGGIKHALINGRKTMQEIFDRRCSLINKNSVCHQCSELNGIFNPKQDFQEQKVKVGLHNDSGTSSKEELFALRTRIAKAIDPYQCNGADLHFFHFDHIDNVLNASPPQ